MAQTILIAAVVLGVVGPLLRGWRPVLAVLLGFAIVNGWLLYQVRVALETGPDPGPGARGFIVLLYLPSVLCGLSCLLRLLIEAFRFVRRRQRDREVSPGE